MSPAPSPASLPTLPGRQTGDRVQVDTQNAEYPGMPPLDLTGNPVSRFEFWHPLFFYIPVMIHWIGQAVWYRSLTLPTAANPRIPAGGLCGESKSAILDQVRWTPAKKWFAPHVTLRRTRWLEGDRRCAQRRLREAGLSFPVVAKPDIGCRGVGVRLIATEADLAAYFAAFPEGERVILQRFVEYEGEAGVFYVRQPGEAVGRVVSLTLKYLPYVVGDGRSTLRELIQADPRAGRIAHLYLARHAAKLDEVIPAGAAYRLTFAGNHFRGAIFRDGHRYITRAMHERFDEIAHMIPEFHFGRFDVRFPTIRDLQNGRDFTIIEVNGIGAEPTHIWDRDTKLLDAYLTLFQQTRQLFRIGQENRRRGFKPMRALELLRCFIREKRLFRLYPLTQ